MFATLAEAEPGLPPLSPPPVDACWMPPTCAAPSRPAALLQEKVPRRHLQAVHRGGERLSAFQMHDPCMARTACGASAACLLACHLAALASNPCCRPSLPTYIRTACTAVVHRPPLRLHLRRRLLLDESEAPPRRRVSWLGLGSCLRCRGSIAIVRFVMLCHMPGMQHLTPHLPSTLQLRVDDRPLVREEEVVAGIPWGPRLLPRL